MPALRQNSTEIPIPMIVEKKKSNDIDHEMEYHLRRLAMFRMIQEVIPILDEDMADTEDEYYSYGINPSDVIKHQRKLEESEQYIELPHGQSDYDIEGFTDIDGSVDVSLDSDQEHQFDIEI